jgi:ligand-binding sensor domain-containing protein
MRNLILVALLSCLQAGIGGTNAGPKGSNANGGQRPIAGHRVVKSFPRQVYDEERHLYISLPTVIYQDTRGVSWIGTIFGIYSYDESSERWTGWGGGTEERFLRWVGQICEDREGRTWLLSGITRCPVYRERDAWRKACAISDIASPADIRTMFADRQRRIWLALPYGLVTYDGRAWLTAKPPRTIDRTYAGFPVTRPDRSGALISEADDRLDVGDEGSSGLGEPDDRKAMLVMSDVAVAIGDSEGSIWLGCRKGIVRYSEATKEWSIFRLPAGLGEISSIYEDRKGRLWFGDTSSHVASYDRGSRAWRSYDLVKCVYGAAIDNVDAIYQDKADNMMFGAGGGLITFAESRNKWEIFIEPAGNWPGGAVSAIVQDRIGRIWVGAAGGIAVLDP